MLHFILFFLILSYPILTDLPLFYSIPVYSILFYSILFCSVLFCSVLFYSILFFIANEHHRDDSEKGKINQIFSNTVNYRMDSNGLLLSPILSPFSSLPSPPLPSSCRSHSRPSGIWSQEEEASIAGSLLFKVWPKYFPSYTAIEFLSRNSALTSNTLLADFDGSVCLFGWKRWASLWAGRFYFHSRRCMAISSTLHLSLKL